MTRKKRPTAIHQNGEVFILNPVFVTLYTKGAAFKGLKYILLNKN